VVDRRALSEFSMVASFADGAVTLALQGEVDALTAPEFDAVFDAMIERGHPSVALDLSALRFMDGSGLTVIARGAQRLEASGGTLTIHAPSDLVGRLLEITGFAHLVELGLEESAYGHLGPEEQRARSQAVAGVLGSHGMAKHVSRYAAVHSDDELVDGALRLAVSLAHAVVGGADGASVSLRRRGELSTVAATDQTILAMDANQYETGQGPCIDASTEGHWFHAESLARETRWPAFVPRARALGIEAILSSPLLVRESPVGALNIYSSTAGAFTIRDQEVAAAFSVEASRALRNAAVDGGAEDLSLRIQGALRTRQVIAEALGIFMERQGLSETEAFRMLRRSSLEHGIPLQERAEQIVASTRGGPILPDG
jgi:anti-anti-sigma factor